MMVSMLLILSVGSIFIYQTQPDDFLVKEHEKKYPLLDSIRNEKELILFKSYFENLPKEYREELKKIKQAYHSDFLEYKSKKKALIQEHNYFGFKHRKAFWTYVGMFLCLIGVSISGFIAPYIRDKTPKLILNTLFSIGIMIGVFFIYWAIYDEFDLILAQHYFAAFSFILGSILMLLTLHKYLINYPFYMTSISQLNKWILLKALNFISNDKKQKYIEESIKHIERTLYTEKGNKFN